MNIIINASRKIINRKTGLQRDRQKDKQTDRKKNRQKDRKKDKYTTNRKTDISREKN